MSRHFSPYPRFIPLIGLVLILFGLPAGAVADAPAVTYSFTILDVPDAIDTSADSINASGQVTGSYWDGSVSHGFMYSNDTFTTFNGPDGTSIEPSSINASGQITGRYRAALPPPSHPSPHGFVYSNGTFATLDVPSTIGTDAASINASGQVTGTYWDSSGAHGFVYSNGTFATLDVPGAVGTIATSINDSGQVTGDYIVGGSGTHSFVYSNGTYTTLDVPGAIDTQATSINDSGQVTGTYRDGSGNHHGFVYSGGTFTTFNGPDTTDAVPSSINASGQVTGGYFVYPVRGSSSNPVIPRVGSVIPSPVIHGFVYSNGTFMTLDVPGAIDTQAISINDSGQVAGHYYDGSRNYGFIATPIGTLTDIPTLSEWAILLLLSLLLGLSGWWLRQRKLF